MNDIDFDEIDRAVNSVISSLPSKDNQPTQVPEQKDNNQEEPKIVNRFTMINKQPERTAAKSLVGSRSVGRFMDLVRPKSNDQKDQEASNPVINTAKQEAPKDQILDTSRIDTEEAGPADNQQSGQDSKVDLIDYREMVEKSEEMFARDAQSLAQEAADVNTSTDESKPSQENNIQNIQKPSEVLDSPFIPNTKVEKRPLGAFSVEQSPADTEENKEPESHVENVRTFGLPGQNENMESPLPPELQDDLLSIESSEDLPDSKVIGDTDLAMDDHAEEAPVQNTMDSKQEPENEQDVQSQTIENVQQSATEASSSEKKETIKPEARPAISGEASDYRPASPTSITQQYREQPRSDEPKNVPIYDTEAYHKSLVSPMQKKPSWMIALWIIGLLLLGIGVGALVYMVALSK